MSDKKELTVEQLQKHKEALEHDLGQLAYDCIRNFEEDTDCEIESINFTFQQSRRIEDISAKTVFCGAEVTLKVFK